MSETGKLQIELADLVAQCRSLLTKISERVAGAQGAADAAQGARRQNESGGHSVSGENVIPDIDEEPAPKIGDTVGVVRYEYVKEGDYFEPSYEMGTIIRIGAGYIEVQLPEQVIPARTVLGPVVKAEWRECSEEWAYDA